MLQDSLINYYTKVSDPPCLIKYCSYSVILFSSFATISSLVTSDSHSSCPYSINILCFSAELYVPQTSAIRHIFHYHLY